MTKQEYKKKFQEIVNWAEKETQKISKNVQNVGLDDNKDKYKKIHDEYQNKINELKKELKNNTY